MKYPFLIYLKNKTSQEYEYKRDVSAVTRTNNGYRITFSNGRSYSYGADKVKYYPFVSTSENVRISENGKLNETYDTVDNYGHYLIFRNGDNNSYPIKKSSKILLKALEGIDLLESRSALFKYIATSKETLIYPFGCNKSQKLEVRRLLILFLC